MTAGGQNTLNDSVATTGMTFQEDGNATLVITQPIAAGNTIDLVGNSNTISIPLDLPAVGATDHRLQPERCHQRGRRYRLSGFLQFSSAFYGDNALTLTADI